ncbi:hypothetical protein [Bacteroides acidifaciens]|uniref:hypothetical protein n=1 Tax=Bacteroides acidifaciens TaxID=85831 RepID=UPI003F68D2AB
MPKHLGDWIPSLGISYKVNDGTEYAQAELSLPASTVRGFPIENPAVEETPDEISNGNPSLKSAHPHNIFTFLYADFAQIDRKCFAVFYTK